MLVEKLQELVPKKIHPILGDIYHRCRGILHLVISRGNESRCCFCNHSYSQFLPIGYKHAVLKEMQIIGGSYRMNAECPYCGSLDRERLVDQFLKNRSLLNTGMQILHIAPEKNLQRMMKQKGINLVSADLDSPLASLKMDIQQIPFPDDHFDAIICNHVLEHIPDDIKAMHELYRVLKPGGWAILQVPFSPLLEHSYEDPTITDSKDRARIFGQKDHVRIYGLDYPSRLQSVGFKVEAEKLDPTLIKRFALNPREIVFFCRK